MDIWPIKNTLFKWELEPGRLIYLFTKPRNFECIFLVKDQNSIFNNFCFTNKILNDPVSSLYPIKPFKPSTIIS